MTSRDFAFWLQGFFEIADPKIITIEQTQMIKAHLGLVFKHEIDPSMGDQKHQDELNAIHNVIKGDDIVSPKDRPPFRPHIPILPYPQIGGRDEDGNVMRC